VARVCGFRKSQVIARTQRSDIRFAGTISKDIIPQITRLVTENVFGRQNLPRWRCLLPAKKPPRQKRDGF
jgi:hypothetical protein